MGASWKSSRWDQPSRRARLSAERPATANEVVRQSAHRGPATSGQHDDRVGSFTDSDRIDDATLFRRHDAHAVRPTVRYVELGAIPRERHAPRSLANRDRCDDGSRRYIDDAYLVRSAIRDVRVPTVT